MYALFDRFLMKLFIIYNIINVKNETANFSSILLFVFYNILFKNKMCNARGYARYI